MPTRVRFGIRAILLICVAGCAQERGPEPWNVILVTLDTTRRDAVAPYDPFAATPNLARLAAGATVFEHAWATAPWTLPTHASMFTGLYPSHHGAGVTLDELIRNADEAMYEAKTTPHMFVIGTEGELLYDGAIDDDAAGKSESPTNFVEAALTSALAGQPVETAQTKPYGCSVKYKK